jgi:hypothetical protein
MFACTGFPGLLLTQSLLGRGTTGCRRPARAAYIPDVLQRVPRSPAMLRPLLLLLP